MRIAEWIQGGFAVALALAAWLLALVCHARLPAFRARRITLMAAIVVAVLAVARSTAWFLPPGVSSTIRDWTVFILLMFPYWQAGQFFRNRNSRLEEWLMALDRRWLGRLAASTGTSRSPLNIALEIAYFFCYPFVPLGLGALYLADLQSRVDGFWTVVLTATYLCYAVTPFFPAMPPRALVPQPRPAETNRSHRFNRWLQELGSIHAISFPSAHVASTMAVSLVLLRLIPPAGLCFLGVALAIAVAAVVLRYHYALDVVLGAAVALAVFLVWQSAAQPG